MDRLQIIDTAVQSQWLDRYAPLVKWKDIEAQADRDSKIWWVPSRRDFASLFAETDDASKKQNDERSRRLIIPRISIMRLDVAPDPDRQRPTNLRLRGVGHTTDMKRVYSSPLPIPINIDYQIDFWTRRISEMNRWEIQFNTDFQQQVHYITMEVDDLFQTKYIGLLAAAGLEDNSDLEPGEDRPSYRKTARITAPTWIFPTADQIESDPAVQEILADVYAVDAQGFQEHLGLVDP